MAGNGYRSDLDDPVSMGGRKPRGLHVEEDYGFAVRMLWHESTVGRGRRQSVSWIPF